MPELCVFSQEGPHKKTFPVELLSPAIGKFAVEINALKSDNEIQLPEDVNTIVPLIAELCCRPKDEIIHKAKFKELLVKFFDSKKYDITTSSSPQSVPDLAVFSSGSIVPEIIVKVKKGHQGTNADPLVESVCYYRKFIRHGANNVYPCLLLILEGSTLLIYGCASQFNFKKKSKIVEYDKTVVICSRPLFVFDFASNNFGQDHIFHCCKIFKHIEKTCTELVEEKCYNHNFNGYYPISLLKIEEEWGLQRPTRIAGKLVFENDDYIWKFCNGYGLQAHEFAYELGIAPKLLTSSEVCGTWRLIKMERIKGNIIEESDKGESHDLQSWNDFTKCFNKFNENFVHGDVRFPNIIRREVDGTLKYYLLDFDWCSSIEEVKYYPPFVCMKNFSGLTKDLSFGPCLPILVEHDRQQIQYITTWMTELLANNQ